ncbi:hypothetical protein EYF80_058353 [Liparis tanakae]|uniref:Uncharacterized protein n=1 Tax=Liparis tanakae TaxID=230148 RepID=A0A4Z2ERF8_9TELE|nr:hypothetical protein EYF80_058353 [Liparis tanakae]
MLKRKAAQADCVGSMSFFSTSKHVVIPSSGTSKVRSVVISGHRTLRTTPHMRRQLQTAMDFLTRGSAAPSAKSVTVRLIMKMMDGVLGEVRKTRSHMERPFPVRLMAVTIA